jgi:hypothetical protein
MGAPDPVATALRVADALQGAGVENALCGGLLVAIYGEPRETIDADLAVASAPSPSVADALRGAGFEAIEAFHDLRLGGLAVTRFTLLPGGGSAGLDVVDLVRPRSDRYARAALGRAVRVPLRNREIPALTPEDFVLFKVLSTRARDLEDALGVLRSLGGQLDRAAIEEEIPALASEIPDGGAPARWAELRAREADPLPG